MIAWLEDQECSVSLAELICYCFNAFGKKVSKSTLRRILQSAEFIWKRIRHSLKKKRDAAAFEAFAQQLMYWKIAEDRGWLDLYFFDESGFNLKPYIPYAWQRKGRHIELFPDNRNSRHTVLGFINRQLDFHASLLKGAPNAEFLIAWVEQFCQDIRHKPNARTKTIVIMDNNPTHRSKAFRARLEPWRKQGLYIVFLPPYSPELNSIEILWRFIKYKWMPFYAYENENSLVKELVYILQNIGLKYRITFD